MNHFYRFIMADYLQQHRYSGHFANLDSALWIGPGQMKLHALIFTRVGAIVLYLLSLLLHRFRAVSFSFRLALVHGHLSSPTKHYLLDKRPDSRWPMPCNQTRPQWTWADLCSDMLLIVSSPIKCRINKWNNSAETGPNQWHVANRWRSRRSTE